jgi:hypothetical protein
MKARTDGSRLCGSAELQLMLGVSRQRITQLTAGPGFPEPVAELRMGKVWDLEDVKAWAKQVGRTLEDLPESVTAGSGKYRRG